MSNTNEKSKDNENNIDFFDKEEWDKLKEDDGDGSYCCGKRMVLAPSEICYECLNCGAWEYSSC